MNKIFKYFHKSFIYLGLIVSKYLVTYYMGSLVLLVVTPFFHNSWIATILYLALSLTIIALGSAFFVILEAKEKLKCRLDKTINAHKIKISKLQSQLEEKDVLIQSQLQEKEATLTIHQKEITMLKTPKYNFNFNVLWDKDLNPHCPVHFIPLIPDRIKSGITRAYCNECQRHHEFHDEQDNPLLLKEARKILKDKPLSV